MAVALRPVLDTRIAISSPVDLSTSPPAEADWAASGGRALTGFQDGPPLEVRGHPAAAARAGLAWLSSFGPGATVPGVELLGERASVIHLTRNAPFSCGGAMQILPCTDGHIAVSLARPSDHDVVPAIVQSQTTTDSWTSLRRWAAALSANDAADRCQLLGVPASPVGAPAAGPSRPWLVATRGGARRARGGPLVVVDLTSLWAGPLCARLLRGLGAQVTKVESASRPDGSRSGHPEFFERMNSGSTQIALDFDSRAGRVRLLELLRDADVVLEGSRPRALRQLGVRAEEMVSSGTIWLSITARGRDSDWVGFGDDVAAGAGLLAEASDPLPAGDALADPLAGIHAAVAVAAAWGTPHGWLLDLSMHDTARLCVEPPRIYELSGDR